MFLLFTAVAVPAGTLVGPNSMSKIPTVQDNLFNQGAVKENKVGICFFPATPGNLTDGEITFGGVDSTKFNEPLSYVYGIIKVRARNHLLNLFSVQTNHVYHPCQQIRGYRPIYYLRVPRHAGLTYYRGDC